MSVGGNMHDGTGTVEWYTPPHIFEALAIDYDLDPAAPPGGVPWIPAENHYTEEDDGLAQPWHGRVWLNPPYGTLTKKFVNKLVDHSNGIALVFARTCTVWAQEAMEAADVVCFIAGRLKFVRGSGDPGKGNNAAAPSMLLAYGDVCAEAVAQSKLGVTFI